VFVCLFVCWLVRSFVSVCVPVLVSRAIAGIFLIPDS